MGISQMGLGKTIQTIAYLSTLQCAPASTVEGTLFGLHTKMCCVHVCRHHRLSQCAQTASAPCIDCCTLLAVFLELDQLSCAMRISCVTCHAVPMALDCPICWLCRCRR